VGSLVRSLITEFLMVDTIQCSVSVQKRNIFFFRKKRFILCSVFCVHSDTLLLLNNVFLVYVIRKQNQKLQQNMTFCAEIIFSLTTCHISLYKVCFVFRAAQAMRFLEHQYIYIYIYTKQCYFHAWYYYYYWFYTILYIFTAALIL